MSISYEIMLDKDTLAMKTLIGEFGDFIKTKAGEYWIEDTDVFGIMKTTQIFKNYNYSDCVHLFFNPTKYGMSIGKFLNRFLRAVRDVKEQIMLNDDIKINKEFEKIIKIIDENGTKKVVYDTDYLTDKLNEYGFICIINHLHSETYSKTILDYRSRPPIEQWIDTIKNELGFHTLHVHNDDTLNGKIQLVLVASIIYYRIFEAAKAVGKTVQEIIRDLIQLKAQYINDNYCFINSAPKYINKFLEELEGDESIFDEIVEDLNLRLHHNVLRPAAMFEEDALN